MRSICIAFVMVVVLSTALTSCKKDSDNPDPVNKDAQVHFVFSHFVGSEEIAFDTIKYTNAAGNHYGVSTLRYFVSDFVLKKIDGNTVLFDETHYVDATVSSTLTFDPAMLTPAGEYESLSFVFGLSEAKNVSGAFPNPPESNMEWPLPIGGGYHYMKLEGKFDSTDLVKNYQAHFGPLMGTHRFINISVDDLSFTVDGSVMTIEITMDINKWWTTPNTFDLNIMSGVMQNETIQQQLMENGADIFSAEVY